MKPSGSLDPEAVEGTYNLPVPFQFGKLTDRIKNLPLPEPVEGANNLPVPEPVEGTLKILRSLSLSKGPNM